MPRVDGLSAQAARARIKAAGCTGAIYRTTICLPAGPKFVPLIGRVQDQAPDPGVAIPSKKAVEIVVGVTGDASACSKLTPPKQPATGVPALDGDWTATFTVQKSPGVPTIGQQLTGITFTVKNGRLGGNLSGTIDQTGHPDPNGLGLTEYDANVTAAILGVSCQGQVTFWMYEDRGQAGSTAGITCGADPNQIVGDFRAGQNQ